MSTASLPKVSKNSPTRTSSSLSGYRRFCWSTQCISVPGRRIAAGVLLSNASAFSEDSSGSSASADGRCSAQRYWTQDRCSLPAAISDRTASLCGKSSPLRSSASSASVSPADPAAPASDPAGPASDPADPASDPARAGGPAPPPSAAAAPASSGKLSLLSARDPWKRTAAAS